MLEINMKERGFEGVLLPGNGSKEKIVIVVAGSNDGKKIATSIARFYQKNGIPALVLALFGTQQTRDDLQMVPIEYAKNAIEWLKGQGYQKIGIDGFSRGSEFALLAASKYEDITCVIVRSGCYFVTEGLAGQGNKKRPATTSCWSVEGQPIPYTPYNKRRIDFLQVLKDKKEFNILSFNKDKEIVEESIIPIEKINGPILMISSKRDTIWPSYHYGASMMERLGQMNFKYQNKHISYSYISHMLTPQTSLLYKLGFIAEREDKAGCQRNRDDLNKQVLAWVNEIW